MKYIILLIFFLSGCESPSSPTTLFTGNVMTIDYRVIIGQELTEQQQRQIEQVLQKIFNDINQVYNKWNPDSELSQLNQLKAGERAHISPALDRFLQQTQHLVTLTGGRFDPTIEPLQQLWKQHLNEGSVPAKEEIATIAPAIGWDKVHIKNGIFYKDHDKTRLDLGGIAKGYCVDLIVEALNAAGFANIFVEWGGEIRTSGKHPDERPWHIFISRLGDTDPDHAIAHIDMGDQAIATSGDYLQHWIVDDVAYTHIFDSKTLQPLTVTKDSIASASVLASSCMFADGLATAAMLFPSDEEAKSWLRRVQEQFPEMRFWLESREATSKK